MAHINKSLILPSIVFPKSHQESEVSGLVVGVVPHLDPKPSEVLTISDSLGSWINPLEPAQVPSALKPMLKQDEVMYLVIGKWPPPKAITAQHLGLSPSSKYLFSAMEGGASMQVVIGPWQGQPKKTTCPQCGHEF